MSKLLVAWVAWAGLGLVACSKDAPPTAEEPRTPASTRTEVTAPQPVVEAPTPAPAAAPPAAKFSEEGFELTLTPTAPLKAGQKGELSLSLSAKEPYHVNDKYPYKLEWKAADGVSFEQNPAQQGAFTVEKMTVTAKLGVTAAAAGKTKVSGVFKFSVCTDDKCLMEKRELSLDLEVN